MSSKYPKEMDMFETKIDAISQDDPSGDYVMASDINELQDAILSIQEALGLNPQGSFLTVNERLSTIGVTALRVPSLLMYLGRPAAINEAVSVKEAIDHFLKYDQIVLGFGVEEPANAYHASTKEIINGVLESRNVNFYGYIDCGMKTANLTMDQIQIKINQWKNMGVVGIFCDNMGYDSQVSRGRQNLILESIHQYHLTAIVSGNNPDDLFSDVQNPTYNPNWTASSVQEGDAYYFTSFCLDTTSADVYMPVAAQFEKITKLYEYRKNQGIKLFGSALIGTNISADVGQSYYEYAHTAAMMLSMDAFGTSVEDNGKSTNKSLTFKSISLLGSWYSKYPEIIHNTAYTVHTRQTSFGSITIDTSNHTYRIDGLTIPTNYLSPVANTVDARFLLDASIEDIKIKSYNGSRLIQSINDSQQFININRIAGLTDSGGNISEGLIQANVLKALNAQIGTLQAGEATIGALTAGEIKTGNLNAERITSSVIAAINLYAAEMQVGDAQINNAVIGTLTAEHIKASVIEAINISAESISADKLKATVVEAINISAQDIAADRIRANVITAINAYVENMQIGDAKINTAVIGELTTDHIKAKVIEAINLSTDTATINAARIQALTADHIKAMVIQAINISAETAKIDSAKIGTLTVDNIIANVVEAINLSVETATIDGARIRDLNADHITAGTIAVDRMSANVIDAVNLQAGTITAGSAIINAGAIGTLAVSHMQAAVINAINASIESATINAARIGLLKAENIETDAITADKIKAGAVTAGKIDAGAVTAGTIAADAIKSGNIEADTITTRELAVDAVEADNIKANAVIAGKVNADVITAREIKAEAIEAEHIKAGAVTADAIYAGSVTTEKIAANAITADLIKANVISAINLSAQFISGARIEARTIDADRIKAYSITATEIASKTITADNIAAGAITSDKITAGSIDSDHITTGGLNAEIVTVFNPTTGEVLIGGGFLRVDGLDVGVVQSDNLLVNGLFLTASSAYGLWRDNQAGEVILGAQSEAKGGHQVWKINTSTGQKLSAVPIPGKKPFGVAFDGIEKHAYVTVQGDDTIIQIDLANNVITSNMLKSTGTPGRIMYTGKDMVDHKHFLVMGTDPDDLRVPDPLMIVDAGPTSINSALYMHHVIPMGNSPYDMAMDADHNIYVTMKDEGDIVVLSMHEYNSYKWKVIGRIPIAPFGTDNYHGGLDGEFGLNMAVGGSAAISYQEEASGGGHVHGHGGYGSADGSMKKYEPRGIALSTDSDTLYVVDNKNNQLLVVDKKGNAFYNPLTGTRERGNLGHWGQPSPSVSPSQGGSSTDSGGGGGHDHHANVASSRALLPLPEPPLPPEAFEDRTPIVTGLRDYTNTNGETHYVRYRIDIGDSPEFVAVHDGKIFITLSGSNEVAILDEAEIITAIESDRDYYYNEFAEFPAMHHFSPRFVSVGSKPIEMIVDYTNSKLYVALTAQNQIAVLDTSTEQVSSYIDTGANPRGMALSEDGSTLLVANYGGSGNLSFVYNEGPYIGDAYIGLEGQISTHGGHGWMPNRSDWIHGENDTIASSSTVEFRINEPFLNEGGYVKMSAQGKDYQWATIEQDIVNVVNYSDGTNPMGTWYRFHNGSAQIAIANGSSPNFATKFEIDEFIPKYVIYDNQQTEKFTPIEDGINEEYDGLEYSIITNRAHMANVKSSVKPVAGSLSSIVDNLEPANTEEEEGGHGHGGHTLRHTFGETVVFPAGLQSVTIDLGQPYMVPKIAVLHSFHQKRKYHKTKTEVSLDGIVWKTVFDSAVSGEYNDFVEHHMGADMVHRVYGNHITFPAIPVRYVRDWCNGYTQYDDNWANPVKKTENHWTEIKVYGDWEVIYGETYPPNTDKEGEPLATNGKCYVSTDIRGAYIAHDIAIEFTSWSWITYIAGPEYGQLSVEMPSLMSSEHYVDQNWPYKTNVGHKHVMTLSPSLNVKEDEMQGIKAGKHRLVFRQSSGRVTIDRLRYDDYQFYAKSSTLVPSSSGSTYRRFKIIAEQAQGYQGIGKQSTEGAYDEVRVSPDTGLPDRSVAIKYRFRVKSELNANGTMEERGITYVTSCILETGKLSSHWRMSQSGDLFPGTRIESWDPSQPHKTGLQHDHLANGSVRGNKIMPGAIMNHHISRYARIAEFKLDLDHPTHGHGRMIYTIPGLPGTWIDNKETLDQIEGWGVLVDDSSGHMVESEYSGKSNRLARADHRHAEIEQASHSHGNKIILDRITAATGTSPINLDLVHGHSNKAVLDLFSSEAGKLIWNGQAVGAGNGGGGALVSGSVLTAHIRLANGNNSADTGSGIITDHIRDNQVTNIKIASGIDGAKIAPGSTITLSTGKIITGAGSTFGGNVTITGDGVFYVGTSSNDSQDGEVVVRNGTGLNAIHLDGDSSGKIDSINVKSYIAGNGNADFAGTVKVNTLQLVNGAVITNLNAEKLNGLVEADFVKTPSIRDLTGFGVDTGMKVIAQTIPNMTVRITSGVAYTASGKRFAYSGTDSIPLQQPSMNYDRLDVIYIQGPSSGAQEGALATMTGTPASSPVQPTLPSDGIKLAVVRVRQNAGTVTDGTSGSYAAITDHRVYRAIRYQDAKFQVQGHLRSSMSSAKLTIPAGQTEVIWTHGYGDSSYAVSALPSSTARHVYYKNLTENTVEICIDEPHISVIDVLVMLVGY